MSEQEQSMQELTQEFQTGQVVQGKVIRIDEDNLAIDFGYKEEGVVTKKEWSFASLPAWQDVVTVGEVYDFAILSLNEPPQLSRKATVNASTWENLRHRFEQHEVFTVKILTVVKGGLVADVEGLRAFLPASLVDVKFVQDLSGYINQSIEVVIAEVSEDDKRLILSHKQVKLQEEQLAKLGKFDEFAVGQKVKGTVARLTQFGAFIDLGGVDGLLHISEMSHERIEKPEDVVTPGQEIEVEILRIEKEAGRISLSMKGKKVSAWNTVLDQFQVGAIVEGTVKRLSNFGAFVEVAHGIEGLVHVSQIADKRIAHPSEALSAGDQVMVKILEIKPDEERMALSIREAKKETTRREEKKKVNAFVDKQTTESTSTTIGDLFGDLLRDKFK